MPLTDLQKSIARAISSNRSEESYLAGGAALHLSDQSLRFSNDLDYFHSSSEATNRAATLDCKALIDGGMTVEVVLEREGFVRVLVDAGGQRTKIEWVHDTTFRFLPIEVDPIIGYRLSSVDIAINKVLALVGREEPRDFLDVVEVSESVLPLGGLLWGACGKDPGFTPEMLFSLVRRRGHYRPGDFDDLRLREPLDLVILKRRWLSAVDSAQEFLDLIVDEEPGCLFYSKASGRFVGDALTWTSERSSIARHLGSLGGEKPPS